MDVVLAQTSTVEPERVAEELKGFQQLLASSPQLSHALSSPSVAPARKRAVVDKLAKQLAVSRPVRNFLLVLIDHRRAGQLPEIVRAFERLMDERLGILQVDVVSARPLTERQQDAFTKGLETATGKRIWLNQSVDDALIGGILARIGSTIFDGSVRGKLAALERRLID